MKFTVNREKLLKGLQKVSSIIGSRSMLPILGNVLVTAEDDKLSLCSTDLEIRISTEIECAVIESGSTTMPAKKLLALVSRFIADEVEFTVNENDHIKLDCGTGHFTLLGLAAADFPEASDFKVLKTIKIAESEFKGMLSSISYAVSQDDSRKVLTGILMSTAENMLTLVATDGKRLALQEKMIEDIAGNDGECVVPLKAANEVKRVIDSNEVMEILIGDNYCCFKGTNFVLTTKLIDGKYPNFRQVIPASAKHTVEVPAATLLAKIEMVSQILSETSSFVVLNFEDNNLTIKGSSSEVGEGADSMEIEYTDEPISVSFNPVFLADPLKVVSADNVQFKLNDPFNPVTIEGKEGFLCVIMPVRK
ncbi:MAG: DNA polymerase III subunit beta [Lentisphaeria bacterium]|nr:DNA polymerase III subunit beta [Lentisphaeria bacterium]